MSNAQVAKIKIEPMKMANLMNDVATGKFRVPQFQREFVWPKKKVVDLFDSIYKEFPIGSLFMWNADKSLNFLFRELVGLGVPPVGKYDDISFILDGQQRITSIYAVLKGLPLHGTDYSAIYFDLDEEKFTEDGTDDGRYIKVCDLWGLDLADLVQKLTPARLPAMATCRDRLAGYPLSVVEVRDKELADVCVIFQRINQGGKRLDSFDLVCATTFSTDFNLREKFASLSKLLEDGASFGLISPSCITQLMALQVYGDCGESKQFKLTSDQVQTLWPKVVKAVSNAAIMLRKSVGVVDASFLPYDAHLTLASYFLLLNNNKQPTPAQLAWLKKWFWTTAFSQHYGAESSSKTTKDGELMKKVVKGQTPKLPCDLTLTADDLLAVKMNQSNSARRNAFLCLLASRNPVSLQNGQEYDIVNGDISEFNKKEKHHIFPQGFLTKSKTKAEIHALPNFCFLDSQLNKTINATDPATYMPALGKANSDLADALDRQLIPPLKGSGLLTNDFDAFVKKRAAMILAAIQGLC